MGQGGEPELELTEPKPSADGVTHELPMVVVSDLDADTEAPSSIVHLETPKMASHQPKLCIQVSPHGMAASRVVGLAASSPRSPHPGTDLSLRSFCINTGPFIGPLRFFKDPHGRVEPFVHARSL